MRLRISILLAACIFALIAAAPKAHETSPALIGSLHLYNPPEQFAARLGGAEGGKDLGRYTNEVVRITGEFASACSKPRPKGVFIGIGVKPGKQARCWCESIDGEISPEQLKELEAKLAKIPAPLVKQGPLAVGLSISFFGKEPSFQPYPVSWAKATEAAGREVPLAPDELFKLIWPDTTAAANDDK